MNLIMMLLALVIAVVSIESTHDHDEPECTNEVAENEAVTPRDQAEEMLINKRSDQAFYDD